MIWNKTFCGEFILYQRLEMFLNFELDNAMISL